MSLYYSGRQQQKFYKYGKSISSPQVLYVEKASPLAHEYFKLTYKCCMGQRLGTMQNFLWKSKNNRLTEFGQLCLVSGQCRPLLMKGKHTKHLRTFTLSHKTHNLVTYPKKHFSLNASHNSVTGNFILFLYHVKFAICGNFALIFKN